MEVRLNSEPQNNEPQNFEGWLQSTDFVVVLVPYKTLIHEDEDEKNQIRSHAYALGPIPCSS